MISGESLAGVPSSFISSPATRDEGTGRALRDLPPKYCPIGDRYNILFYIIEKVQKMPISSPRLASPITIVRTPDAGQVREEIGDHGRELVRGHLVAAVAGGEDVPRAVADRRHLPQPWAVLSDRHASS